MKKKDTENLQKRFYILNKLEKTNPVLMSDRSFFSEAYGSFADNYGRDSFKL